MIEALIYTCIIEAAVTFLIMCGRGFVRTWRLHLNKGSDYSHGSFVCIKDLRMVWYNLLCNMLTNPLLNLGLYGAVLLGAGAKVIFVLIIIGELCVVAAEYKLYRLMSREPRNFCIILSLVTNIASYGIGRLIL